MDDFEKIKRILDNVDEKTVEFTMHFYKNLFSDRPKIEHLVKNNLYKTDRLLNVKRQQANRLDEEKFRFEIKLSRKYILIVDWYTPQLAVGMASNTKNSAASLLDIIDYINIPCSLLRGF